MDWQDCTETIQWIVVNNNPDKKERKQYKYTAHQTVIDAPPDPKSKLHPLCQSYLTALPHVLGDKILFWDDDDIYFETYIRVMSRLLDTYDLVGQSNARYYHLPERKWQEMRNEDYASLAQTGMTLAAVNTFKQVAKAGTATMDGTLWTHWRGTLGRSAKIIPSAGLHVALKDGRGIGTGHVTDFGEWTADPQGEKLREWTGVLADRYSGYYINTQGPNNEPCVQLKGIL